MVPSVGSLDQAESAPPENVQLFVTPWTIQSMEFCRPEYWSGQPFLSPGDLPNPGTEPVSSSFDSVDQNKLWEIPKEI